MYFILFFVCIASMLLCHTLAKKKGRNPIAWGLTGAIIGPLAIPIILAMKKVNQ